MEVLYVYQIDCRGQLMTLSMYPVLPIFAHRTSEPKVKNALRFAFQASYNSRLSSSFFSLGISS
jgi:hypothetical protein